MGGCCSPWPCLPGFALDHKLSADWMSLQLSWPWLHCGCGCGAQVTAGAVAPHWLPSASPERPVIIVKPLEDQHIAPGEDVVLSCELSRAGAPVRWLKDGKAIRKGQKYDVLSEGTQAVLVVRGASLRDSGEYACETDAAKSTARLHIEGESPWDLRLALTASVPQCSPGWRLCGQQAGPGKHELDAAHAGSASPFCLPLQKGRTVSQRSWPTYRPRSGAQPRLPARQSGQRPL